MVKDYDCSLCLGIGIMVDIDRGTTGYVLPNDLFSWNLYLNILNSESAKIDLPKSLNYIKKHFKNAESNIPK